MVERSLAVALEQEHREIDAGVEGFAADPSSPEAPGLLAAAIAALRRHIYLEEEFLFPALRADNPSLMAPIFVMLREHGQLWRSLDELERDVADGGGTADVLHLCHQMLVQLQHHNLKEERILYPEADRVLPAEAADRLAESLESGRLPGGWVCIKAR